MEKKYRVERVAGLEKEKFCKMLYMKCSENCDYRYIIGSQIMSSQMNVFSMNTA